MSKLKSRRTDAVLIVVDIQERLAPVVAESGAVVSAAALLLEAARLLGVPVVLTRQNPDGLGDIVGDIRSAAGLSSEDAPRVVDKMSFDCFAEASFEAAVEATGRSQLVFCGMESHICVTQTALSAVERGLDVHIAEDACGARSERSHELTMGRLRAEGCHVSQVESVVYEWIERAGTDEFRAVLRLVKRPSRA